jgi:hypothetical protein
MADAPMLQIIPEIRELCVSHVMPLPMEVEHMKVDLPATSCVKLDSPLSSEQLEVKSPEHLDVSLAPIPPSPPQNSDALFAKQLCDLVSKVEATCPGSFFEMEA